MEIIFWSTGCPKCNVLKRKMDDISLEYVTNSDVEAMLAQGMQSAPHLSVDGKLLDFKESIDWIKKLKEESYEG